MRQGRRWRNERELAGIRTTFNVGVHAYDFLSYLLDSDPIEVVALWDDDGFNVEIQSLALIRFANGVTVYVNINQRTPLLQNDISIYGTAGRIVGTSLTRAREDGRLTVTAADGSESTTPYPSPAPIDSACSRTPGRSWPARPPTPRAPTACAACGCARRWPGPWRSAGSSTS
ncbi:MAG TPA: Gfo/Idh/MocA family oxidoreductase, partial [Nocardioidaceae bacterium]|nr:Gfo/Idh/MocA family oxidoreductase [Nocardioidaceae bacterium]